jgi:hypothetical protein
MPNVAHAARRTCFNTLPYEEVTREMTLPFLLSRRKPAFRFPIVVADGDALAALVRPADVARRSTPRVPPLSQLVRQHRRRAERAARYRSLSRTCLLVFLLAIAGIAALEVRSGKLDPRSAHMIVHASRVWLATVIAP